jgi:hypothetical protein
MSAPVVQTLLARASCITKDMEAIEVLQTLLLQLAADPQLHQACAAQWMAPLFRTRKTSVQRMLVQRINTLLTAPVCVELSYMTVRGRDCGTLYLFGRELTIFGIPLDLFRTNFVALACIARLASQGHMSEGGRVFGAYRRSVANTASDWSQFSYNSIVQLQLERTPFVTAIAAHLCAVALRRDTVSPIKTHWRTTRMLMAAALTESLSQIFGSGSTLDLLPWLDSICSSELYAVREACLSDDRFRALEFDRLLLAQYTRICKNQIAA